METQILAWITDFFDIDIFGENINIYYKGKSQRNSWIGRILTFLYIGLYLFYFISKLIRMINRDDVTFYDTYALHLMENRLLFN